MPQINGLPEGVTCVRFGVATDNEYEIIGSNITRGPRQGTVSQVIVAPAKGWKFMIDIRNPDFYYPAKDVPGPEIPELVKADEV